MRLRERAGDHHVRMVRHQLGHGVAERGVDELAVRLVDDHDRARADACEQLLQVGHPQCRASGIVRRGEQHHPRRGRDGLRQRIEVEGVVGVERCGDLPTTHQLRVHRVHLERAPRVHHLIACVDEGEEELLEQAHRAGAHGHGRHVHPEPRGQALAKRSGAMIGVSVRSPGRVRNCFDDRVERRLGVLVRGELDGIGDAVLLLGLCGTLAGAVGGQALDGRSRLGNHVTKVARGADPSGCSGAQRHPPGQYMRNDSGTAMSPGTIGSPSHTAYQS